VAHIVVLGHIVVEHCRLVVIAELCWLQLDMVAQHMDHPIPALLAIPMASDSLLEWQLLVVELELVELGLVELLVVLQLAQQLVDRLVVELSEPVGRLAGRLVDKSVG
jgi:hypothetical protein